MECLSDRSSKVESSGKVKTFEHLQDPAAASLSASRMLVNSPARQRKVPAEADKGRQIVVSCRRNGSEQS